MRIDYLNSVDTTIMGSRNGHAALHIWHSLRTKGLEGIQKDVMSCISTAQYLQKELTRVGITARLNDLSSTVVLERPAHEPFVQKWQLACEEDIAHVVVMPNVTPAKVGPGPNPNPLSPNWSHPYSQPVTPTPSPPSRQVDRFVAELSASIAEHGRTTPLRPESPLALLDSIAWGSSTAE